MKFNLEKAHARIDKVCDEHIRQRLREFVSQSPAPDQSAWNSFCNSFTHERRDEAGKILKDKGDQSMLGAAIKKVRVNDGDPEEFKDLSKDGTGAYRKALKGHKGQLVYLDSDRILRVRPVYAFESLGKVQSELREKVGKAAIKGFFQSGCTIVLTEAVAHDSTPLVPGKYKLNTILTDRRAKVTDASGKVSLPISLEKMFAAGFTRAD